MKAEDFTYDGIALSSLGYIIVNFDDSSGFDSVDTDSQRSFNNFSFFGGKWQPLSISIYKDILKIEISFIKNPTVYDDMTISLANIRSIKRWLNRPDFHELRITNNEYNGIFWMCSANIEEVHHLGECIGFTATFYTDRPFALGDLEDIYGSVAANESITFNDKSDEIGYIYPDFEVTLASSGNLSIVNSFDGRETIINNCTANEKIVMSKMMQISSSLVAHKVCDDFNWRFPRICNSFGNTTNTFTFSLPCSYKITYNPIIKVVIA